MRWPPLPLAEEDSLASACEVHIEPPTKRLQDDDPPEGSRGSIDQYPLIIQVLYNEETQNNDVASFEDLSERSQWFQGIGSGKDVISDSGLLQRPPNATHGHSDHLFPDSDSVDEAGNVSIFDCQQRPRVASAAESTQVVFYDPSQTTIMPDSESSCPKIPPQSPLFNERGSEDSFMLLQPETRPISQEQLVNEVKGIYAGLVMVEKKCVEIDQQLSSAANKLSDEQWQTLIARHRTLLHEHHDFFLSFPASVVESCASTTKREVRYASSHVASRDTLVPRTPPKSTPRFLRSHVDFSISRIRHDGVDAILCRDLE